MSYFDHVQCHSCGARLQPEQLSPGRGEMPACPHCDAALNLTDLFGVKDSFVGMHDNEGNDHSLDDLMGNDLYDSRYASGRAPGASASRPPPSSPTTGGSSKARRPSPGSGSPSLRQLTGTGYPARGAMVRKGRARDPWEDDADDAAPAPSAADLLRSMKKKS